MAETVVSIAFVLCALVAGFLVVHKEEVMAGQIDQVLATYIGKISGGTE